MSHSGEEVALTVNRFYEVWSFLDGLVVQFGSLPFGERSHSLGGDHELWLNVCSPLGVSLEQLLDMLVDSVFHFNNNYQGQPI